MPAAKIVKPTTGPVGTPQPAWLEPAARRALNLTLRQIMLLLVYCAVASLVGRQVYETSSSLATALLGIWLGLGICYLGIWLALRLETLAIVGWITFVIGYCVLTVSMMGILAIAGIPIVIGVLIYLRLQHRRNQRNGLLWVLATAANRAIPLGPGVEAFAQQTSGSFRMRAHVVAALLHQGKSLTDAIDSVPRVLPWDATLLIRLGEQTGQLPAALREATETRSRRHLLLRDLFGRFGYLLGVVAIAQVIMGFNAYFIVPKFVAIFNDFGMSLPVVTGSFIKGIYYFGAYSPWIALAEFAALAYLAFTLGGAGLQGLPLVGRLFRLQHKSLILRALALAVEQNQPLDRALEVMAAHYPNRRVRRKLRVAYNLVRSGASWTAALDGVGLIGLRDLGVLDAATRAGNLAWALRTLANHGERRLAYRLQIGSHVLFVVAMLALGIVILFFCVALFAPLVQLIERLS